MRAGKLRHLLQIFRSCPEKSDVSGEGIEHHKPGDKVWGSVEPLTARELLNAQQTVGDTTHKIRIRYTPNVSRKDRIHFGCRRFEIEAILNTEERNIELVILAHEIN